jgi:hypothetical protein
VFSQGGLGQSRGRSERLVSLSAEGIAVVRAAVPSLYEVPDKQISGEEIHTVDHHLLSNWFQIHLEYVTQVVPQISHTYLTPTSALAGKDMNNRSLVYERNNAEDGRPGKVTSFTPDAVFTLTDTSQGKTLLFFLEVDRGTETVASPARHPRDIRQKLLNYQHYFRTSQFKRYEAIWNTSLNGFRLLFLATTRARLNALCKVVRDMPPSGFVWLTDQEQLFAAGVGAKIWTRGGRHDTALQSILGSAIACSTRLPPLKP